MFVRLPPTNMHAQYLITYTEKCLYVLTHTPAGKGHVPGLVYCLMHPWRVRMRNLAWKLEQHL